jgi:hypothetical protein
MVPEPLDVPVVVLITIKDVVPGDVTAKIPLYPEGVKPVIITG